MSEWGGGANMRTSPEPGVGLGGNLAAAVALKAWMKRSPWSLATVPYACPVRKAGPLPLSRP
eukprot:16326757-Heterocapsa_arctica.AAC.1